MKEIFVKILNLPKKQKIIACSVIYVLVLGIFWQFFFSPVTMELSTKQEQVEDIQTQIAEKQRVVKNLPTFEAEVKKLDQKLERVLLELPDSKEVDAFLKSISVLASDTGLEVTKFTPRPEVPKGFFAELPVSLELQGTFHELVTFFYEVSHLPRIVNVDSIKIVIVTETPSTVIIKASCRATTFRYMEGGGQKDGNKDADKSKRRPE